MKRLTTIVASLGVAVLAVIGPGASAQASSAHHDVVVGRAYVNENTATANTVAGFDRHADGSLTPLAGSPFAAGGAGLGTSVGSQGALQRAGEDGEYLLAVDAGSDQISVLRIGHDGSLHPVAGSPFASNGHEPVSIAVHDDLVYVANQGAGGSNYTGFRLGHGGRLTPIAGSTYPLPDGAIPGDVLFNPDGSRLVGTRVGPSAGPSFIDSFVVRSDGRLTAAPGSPFPSQGVGPLGSEFRPTNPRQLFVTNAHNGPNLGTVSAFTDGSNGTLTPIGSSPFADLQTAPCWIEISHDGRYLFAVNTATPSISRYAISHEGTLTLLGSTPFSNPGGLRPFDARLDPTGRYLYVVGANRVAAFRVDGGNLTELPASAFSLPVGSSAFGIVVVEDSED